MTVSPLREPPKGTPLKKYVDYADSLADGDGRPDWESEDPYIRALGAISLLRNNPPLSAVPVPVYRDYFLRAELEQKLGPQQAAELYEKAPYVIDELARARIDLARQQATPAELRWKPKPSMSLSRGFVLAAFRREIMAGPEDLRSPNALFEATARRLGISRYAVRRLVSRSPSALGLDENAPLIRTLSEMAEFMAEVDAMPVAAPRHASKPNARIPRAE